MRVRKAAIVSSLLSVGGCEYGFLKVPKGLRSIRYYGFFTP